MTLTEAKEALASLQASLYSGILTSERGGRRITYQSVSDMRDAAAQLQRDINKASGKPSVVIGVWDGVK